jgi:hypothetical protein
MLAIFHTAIFADILSTITVVVAVVVVVVVGMAYVQTCSTPAC